MIARRIPHRPHERSARCDVLGAHTRTSRTSAPKQGQFGTDQRCQSGHEGQEPGGGIPRRPSSGRVWPRPETGTTVPQPRRWTARSPGHLVAKSCAGGSGDVDDRAQRSSRVTLRFGRHRRPQQPRGPVHRQRYRHHRHDQRRPQRHVFELAAGDPGEEPQHTQVQAVDVFAPTRSPALNTGPFAGHQVADGAQDDQAVVGDPPPLPGTDREEGRDADRADQESWYATRARRPVTPNSAPVRVGIDGDTHAYYPGQGEDL